MKKKDKNKKKKSENSQFLIDFMNNFTEFLIWIKNLGWYLNFKFEEPIYLFKKIFNKLEGNSKVHPKPQNILEMQIKQIKNWLNKPIVENYQDFISALFAHFINNLKDSDLYSKQIIRDKFPHFFVFQDKFSSIFENIKTIPHSAEFYASLFTRDPTESKKFQLFFEEKMKNLSNEEILQIWNSVDLPITILCRSKWFALKNSVRIMNMDVISFLKFSQEYFNIDSSKNNKNSKENKKNQKKSNDVFKQIISPLNNEIQEGVDLLQVFDSSEIENLIMREFFTLFNSLSKEQQSEIIPKIKLNTQIINIGKSIFELYLKLSNPEIQNITISSFLFSNQSTKETNEKEPHGLQHYLSEIELQDIIMDYLWRFSTWIEKYFKSILLILQDPSAEDDKFKMLGQLFTSSGLISDENFRKLLDLRNSIAHSSYKIKINTESFDNSLIKFPKRKGIDHWSMTWDELLEFTLKFYLIYLSFLRQIQSHLRQQELLTDDFKLLDTVYLGFQADCKKNFDFILDSLSNFFTKIGGFFTDVFPTLDESDKKLLLSIGKPIFERF